MCHYFTRDMGETFQTVIVWLILSPTSLICRSAHLPAGPACVRCPVGQGQAGLWAASAAPLHPMHILMFSQSLTLLMGTSHVSFLLHHCAPCSQVQGTSAHPWLGAWLLSRLLAGLGTVSWEGRLWQSWCWDFGVISMVQTWVGGLCCALL